MGLFEFIGEQYNPGKVGTIDKVEIDKSDMDIKWLVIKSIISVAVIVFAYLIFSRLYTGFLDYLLFTMGIIIYCTIAFFVVPHPDYENIGWLGGLIDHPFRYSDDINRFLIFLLLVLFPGRSISRTFMTWVYYFFIAKDEPLR